MKYIFLAMIIFPVLSFSKNNCQSDGYSCIKTSAGEIQFISRTDSGDEYSYIYFNGDLIYKDKTDYFIPEPIGFENDNLDTEIIKFVVSYYSFNNCKKGVDDYNCNVNILLDLSSKKPIISNKFSPPSEGSHISWASVGKKNSIIAFDDDSRFKYENGKVEMIYGGYVEEQKKIEMEKKKNK
ncbi:hypothetical protein JK232_11665 [Nissabacter archeti]|uniref:Uncharacterized protein n=1 Tax=Nissabacter archeti TaxID=1917880 RepID=A0ABS5JJM6_9GAMM|nr:hypothetical protein [Nissabacter archeti]MBS0969548.1 hypothetical protein [Nissabacter archeti]